MVSSSAIAVMGFLEIKVDAFDEGRRNCIPKFMFTGADAGLQISLYKNVYTSQQAALMMPTI